jgi:uncharacterized membrane protein YbhN (UPF0104 family)
VAKVFYATRENVGRRTQVGTVVVFDRAVGIFSLLSLPVIFAPLFLGLIYRVHVLRLILITYAVIMALLVVVLLASLWRDREEFHIAGHPHRYAALNAVERVLGTIGAYRRRTKTLWSAYGLSLLANLSIIGVIALGVLVVNPASVAWRLCLIVPVGQLVNSLPITPGGLGVGEVAFNTLFRLSGLSGGAETVLCWRVWSALIGGIGLIFYLRGMERQVVEPEAPSDQTPVTQSDTARRSRAVRGRLAASFLALRVAIRNHAPAGTKQWAMRHHCNHLPEFGCAGTDRRGIVF